MPNLKWVSGLLVRDYLMTIGTAKNEVYQPKHLQIMLLELGKTGFYNSAAYRIKP